ncbi:MAG: hypothetical protein ACTHJ8_17810, partial [Mucilaginibacter sp.]
MFKLYPAVFMLLIFSVVVKAQNSLQYPVTTPPNAASFTQYSKVPVGEFTGIPDIKVPMYDIKVDNLHIPVYLSYYARGVQPNVHSGWVGTGWNLVANGVITRKMNGIPDECEDDHINGIVVSGASTHYLGWYYPINRAPLQSVLWDSLSTLNMYTGSNFGGVISDSQPDEFDFSINGISGAFFMGEDGNWKVRAAGGETITVKETIGTDTLCAFHYNPDTTDYGSFPKVDTQVVMKNTFTQFILTTGDGTKYIFGKAVSGGPNTSIDFSRMTGEANNNNDGVVPIAWHITEIDLPSGKKILYNYFRDGHQFSYSSTYSSVWQASSATIPPNISNLFLGLKSADTSATTYIAANATMSISDPVYLQSILFPAGKLIFHSAPSMETDTLDDYPFHVPF